MKKLKNKEKFVIANKLLVDATSGKKLSKTEGSLVNLDDEPSDMFGKIMALPDAMMQNVAELSTETPVEEIKKLGKIKNPRDAKLTLAFEVVKTYHSDKDAKKAREKWLKVFSKKETPEEIEELKLKNKNPSLLNLLLTAGVESKSEARRLIEQGAVKINGETKRDAQEKIRLRDGMIIKIGKRRFWKIAV